MIIEILDTNKNNEKAVESYLDEAANSFKSIQNGISYIDNTKSTEGMGLLVSIWDKFIQLIKNIISFITNMFRAGIFKVKAGNRIKRINKMKADGELNNLDWNKKVKVSADILTATERIEQILNENELVVKNVDNISKPIHNDESSIRAVKILDFFSKQMDTELEITIGNALEGLSKYDKGAPKVVSGSLDSLLKYLKTYYNNSASRIKVLLVINSRANAKLQKIVRKKEAKLDDEDQINIYRDSIKINNICMKLLIKSINYVFNLTTELLDTASISDE